MESTTMLTLNDLDIPQLAAIEHLFEYDETLLIAPTGSGKTVVALTAVDDLMSRGELKQVLIIAPLKVCQLVWRKEHLAWQHLHGLKIGVAIEGDRDKVFKRIDGFDIIVINFEQMIWMSENDKFKHFDGVIIDEVTKLSGGGAWFKSIRRFIKDIPWRVAMSAAPITECWSQLFYIQFFVDAGKALGRNRDKHLRKFFYPTDYKQRNWALQPGSADKLAALVEPTIHVMPDYKDTLPPMTIRHIHVTMPLHAKRVYRDMAQGFKAEGVTAETAAGKMGKLQQIANGFIYTADESIEVHHAKMEALDSMILQAGAVSVLLVYQYEEEKERLKEYYPAIKFLGKNPGPIEAEWNAGGIALMAMHIRSGAHGLNLQAGGHRMILLAPVWSQDQMTQVCDRLWRRGQKFPVEVGVLVATDTIDEIIVDRLNDKAELMPAFLQHIEDVGAERTEYQH